MRLASLHVALALVANGLAWWILRGPLTADSFQDDIVRAMYIRVVAGASLAASLLAAWLGARSGGGRALLLLDVATLPVLALAVARPAVAPISRDLAGLLVVAVVLVRLAPSLAWIVSGRAIEARAVFLASLAGYLALGSWATAAMLAQGDAPHYLLAAEALRRGTVDLTAVYAEGGRYLALAGLPLTAADLRDHVVVTAGGERLVQGYGVAALLLPGWIIAERIGAAWMIALVGAFASAQTFLLLRDVAPARWESRAAWLLTALAAPFVTLAVAVLPNVLGAALLVQTFRWLFAGERSRPALAGLAAGLTFLLTPRDGFAAALLLVAALVADRAIGFRFARSLLAVAAVVAVFDLLAYGLPVPYAGYVFGIAQVQEGVGQPTLNFRADVGLPGMLFDRAFGLLGTAPWVFIGALGAIPLLRSRPGVARPALLVVLGSLAALSVYRLWQGGWAPPNRYLVDVLPLWSPFVAAGLAVVRGPALRAVVAILIGFSAAVTWFLAGEPVLAYQLQENRTFEIWSKYVPAEPLFWLPSFHVDPGTAYLRSVVAALAVLGLVVIGWRRGVPLREAAPLRAAPGTSPPR